MSFKYCENSYKVKLLDPDPFPHSRQQRDCLFSILAEDEICTQWRWWYRESLNWVTRSLIRSEVSVKKTRPANLQTWCYEQPLPQPLPPQGLRTLGAGPLVSGQEPAGCSLGTTTRSPHSTAHRHELCRLVLKCEQAGKDLTRELIFNIKDMKNIQNATQKKDCAERQKVHDKNMKQPQTYHLYS